jgi:hypothetical protein
MGILSIPARGVGCSSSGALCLHNVLGSGFLRRMVWESREPSRLPFGVFVIVFCSAASSND